MTTDSSLPEIKTLKPDAAVALWLKGKDEWNKWVEGNPMYNIDFSHVDFQLYRTDGAGPISFKSFKFPIGFVSFFLAKFGDGGVSFYKTEFGNGNVNFFHAKFGDGLVSFRQAKFGDGDVNFSSAEFGDGLVSFRQAKFGDGDVDFSHAKFGDGDVNFDNAEFGNGDVSFSSAEFGDGDFLFSNMTCRARFTLERLKGELKTLSFRGATFANTVSLSSLKVNSMIDLVNTKLTNQLSLHGLECQLKRTRNRFGLKKSH